MNRPSPRHPQRRPTGLHALGLSTLAIAILLPVFAFQAGCGKKGDPEPPIRMIPATPTGLEAIQRDDRILLSFPYPSTTVAGTPLPEVTEVAVWQLVWNAAKTEDGALPEIEARQFTAAARPERVLGGDALKEVVHGDRIELTLPLASPEEPPEAGEVALSTLAVKTAGPTGEESSFSNLATFVIRKAPEPPTELTLAGTDRGVEIRWKYPDLDDEGAVQGFNVYRRPATERTYAGPLRTVGREARTQIDESAVFERRYIYTVTAVAQRRPTLVESGFGSEAEIDYRDRFPPATPTGLVGLAQEDRVRVVWRPVEASDLAGYRVYRRSPESQAFVALAQELVTAAELVDTDVRTGASYTYRVTAVDRNGNESEPSEQVTATVR